MPGKSWNILSEAYRAVEGQPISEAVREVEQAGGIR